MKVQNLNVDFFKLWLNCKLEKLQEIERLCSAIMDVLEIPEKPFWDGIRKEGADNSPHARKKHPRTKGIVQEGVFGEMFDKIYRGERVIEYTNWREWLDINKGGTFIKRIFYKEDSDDLDAELQHDIAENPLWLQATFFYDTKLDAFSTIRHDCGILLKLLKSNPVIHTEKDFDEIEDAVSCFIQGAFTLIGFHDKEIAEKLQKLEEEKRKRIQSYKNGPGAASAVTGKWTVDAAKTVLDDICGGISGYDALPRGEKTRIVRKIAEALHNPRYAEVPSERNVYILLDKIRNKQN